MTQTTSVGLQASPRQLQLPFVLNFTIPESVHYRALDFWLGRIFENSVMDRLFPVSELAVHQDPMPWVQRGLLLAVELMRIARIPVFDPPRIHSCSMLPQNPGQFRAAVSMPKLEMLPGFAYNLAINTAFQLCEEASANTIGEEDFLRLDDMVIQRYVRQVTRRIMSGKSTIPVLEYAYNLGIPFTHLGGGIFQLGWGSSGRRLDRSVTDRDSAIGATLTKSKTQTAALLRLAGLPAPVHVQVIDKKAAMKAATQIGWPVVIKPADANRGEGVTVDIADEAGMAIAFSHAQKCSPQKKVLVERQVDGVCHRLFIAHGKLLYAVKRNPLAITGDGRGTIAELVETEYRQQLKKPPWKRSELQPLDDLALAALHAAGYSKDSIPASGMAVALRRIESTAWGGVNQEVSSEVHQENVRIALAATALFNLDVAGIDIITADITRPWYENGAIINEVNFAPLLGGREVSIDYVQPFLEELLGGNGRIPVEVFCGGMAAWDAGQRRQRQVTADGKRCVLTTGDRTLNENGTDWPMTGDRLYDRVRALLLSDRVDAMVIVVQADDLLDTGLPLEWVDRVEWVDDRVTYKSSADGLQEPQRRRALRELLTSWTGESKIM